MENKLPTEEMKMKPTLKFLEAQQYQANQNLINAKQDGFNQQTIRVKENILKEINADIKYFYGKGE